MIEAASRLELDVSSSTAMSAGACRGREGRRRVGGLEGGPPTRRRGVHRRRGGVCRGGRRDPPGRVGAVPAREGRGHGSRGMRSRPNAIGSRPGLGSSWPAGWIPKRRHGRRAAASRHRGCEFRRRGVKASRRRTASGVHRAGPRRVEVGESAGRHRVTSRESHVGAHVTRGGDECDGSIRRVRRALRARDADRGARRVVGAPTTRRVAIPRSGRELDGLCATTWAVRRRSTAAERLGEAAAARGSTSSART